MVHGGDDPRPCQRRAVCPPAAQQPKTTPRQVGPEGCGKSLLLDYALQRLPGNVPVARLHCSAHTGPDAVLQALHALCGRPVACAGGRALRPAAAGRAVLHLKNVNMPM